MEFRHTTDYRVLDASNIKIMGRDRVINGTVELFEDVGDNFKVNVTFYTDSAGTGDYRIMPVSIADVTPCEALREYGDYTEPSLQFGVNTNAPYKGDVCPIPKGVYYFNDIVPKTDDWPTQMPRGPVKGILTVKKENVLIGEFEVNVRIENSYIWCQRSNIVTNCEGNG